MSNKQANYIQHLAEKLQHFAWQAAGEKVPSIEQFRDFIAAHMKDIGLVFVSDEQWVGEEKVPALFKSPSAAQSRRMRELAGIPHKDNFV
jgi:hypothetical protein